MESELFSRIEDLRAQLYLLARGACGGVPKGWVLELSSELDRYLVLATRQLTGM
ncbi:MAG: hypothetical protein ACOX2S_06010 [bacterium]